MAAVVGLVVVGALAGFAPSARLLENPWILIALAAAVLGGWGWVILVLSGADEYYGDGTTVWEHSRRSGAWVYVIVGAVSAVASIVSLVLAAWSSGEGRLGFVALRLTAVPCLLLLFAVFFAGIGH